MESEERKEESVERERERKKERERQVGDTKAHQRPDSQTSMVKSVTVNDSNGTWTQACWCQMLELLKKLDDTQRLLLECLARTAPAHPASFRC